MFIAPTKPNEIWAMDFVLDSFENGRRFRVLTVRDIFTREAVLLHADVSIRGDDVALALDGLKICVICPNLKKLDSYCSSSSSLKLFFSVASSSLVTGFE